MEIIFQYPKWFIAFCFILGFVYAFVLYYKTKDFSDESSHFQLEKKAMAIFRFLSGSILAFLLLSPLIKTRFIDKIQPTIVIAHDNSSSINLSFKKTDSTNYINALNILHKSLSNKYELDFYTYSDKILKKDTLTFHGKKTNISSVLNELNGIYYNRNVGAVIFATDGLYNEGQNPVYTDFSFPIYPIALGDTSSQKDLKIVNIRANKIAYLGDEVQIHINLESYNLKGENFKVSLFKHYKGKKTFVSSKSSKIKDDYSEQELSLQIKANSVGIQRYSVVATNLTNEITHENNNSEFYIDVIDSRQKILILANAPHPDIAVLKQTIALNKNLDVTIQYIKHFDTKLSNYNLIILHHLPSNKNSSKTIFTKIKKEKIPYWIITGLATDYTTLNNFQNIVTIKPSAENMNDADAFINENFHSFTIDESTKIKIKRFPPLAVPFGNFTPGVNSSILLFQQIGSVETEYPILSFSDHFGVKSAIFIGDGLWRWKMYDFLDNKNHDAFNEIFSKTINFLALKSDKRKFRVATPKNMFFEGEDVIIEAELYNESYELINEPEVLIQVTNEKGEIFPLSFNRTSNAYQLKTNTLAKGSYTYKASTKYANKKYSAKGAFGIKAIQLESLQTQANHKMLYKLAAKTGGKVFYPNELKKLQELILNKEDIKPTLYESFKTRSIIHIQWIFFLIMTLLSLEWFARKFYGGY